MSFPIVDNSFSNREIVVYALYLLGGATKKCHTEDIALKCFELWPSVFSWTKYVQYPDKEVVRCSLSDARKEKFGILVEGRTGQNRGQSNKTGRPPVADGWILTDAGVKWIDGNKSRFGSDDHIIKDHRQKSLQFLKRMRQHKVFALFVDNTEKFYPSIGDLADLLKCRVDADESVWSARFERLRKHAVASGQEEFILFVEKGMEAYREQR